MVGHCGARSRLASLWAASALLLLIVPRAASDGNSRSYLTLDDSALAALEKIPILSPVPITGPWRGGQTFRVVGTIAEDILNSQQFVLPGYALKTDWMDDTCNSAYAVKLSLSALYNKEYVFLGAHGCSGDCIQMAPAASAVRKPFGSYCCASVAISDPAQFPEMVRFAGSEGAFVNAYAALAAQFGWEKIVVMSGIPRRWDVTAAWMAEKLNAAGFEAVRKGPTTRTPDFADCVAVMKYMKLEALRVIVLMAYPPVMAMMACAAKHVGMPKGIVWLTHAGNPPVDFESHGAGLTEHDPTCTPEALQELWEGEIGVGDNGKPAEGEMDRELDCYPGYTPRTFHAILDKHLVEGYPVGENVPEVVVKAFQGTAADGLCMWALTAKHMFSLGYTLAELKAPNASAYQEMIRYIHDDMSFFGVLGQVDFTGPDLKATLAISQMQSGTRTLVSTFDQVSGSFSVLPGMQLLWGDGNSTPATRFIHCPVGSLMEVVDSAAVCRPCGNSEYFETGRGECLPCPQGFSKDVPGGIGLDACTPCPPGFYSAEVGSTTCDACGAGNFTGSIGMSQCEVCQPGSHAANNGTSECQLCSLGMFAPNIGHTACLSCEDVMGKGVTAFLGATSSSQCICAAGMYLPLNGAGCEGCLEGMVCEEGSDLRNLNAMAVVEGPAPKLLPQHWSAANEPLSVFFCGSAAKCPGGLPGTCAAHLEGISCAHCVDGYTWDGERCRACSGAESSVGLFPVLPLLLVPAVIAGMYFLMRDTIEKWASWQNLCATLVFIILNHYQSIDIVAGTPVRTPQLMRDTYSSWKFTNNLMLIFETQCAGFAGLQSVMAFKAVTPIALAIMCLLVLGISMVISAAADRKDLKMDKDRMFNVFASILFTFFGAVAAMSLELFRCNSNPNEEKTLATDAGIVCYSSDEWQSLLGLSVACVVLYILGVLVALSWVLYVAMWRYQEPAFRTRWKFLFIKYRHGAWWWGLPFLMKNFLMNLVFVIMPAPVYQFYCAMIVVTVYAFLVMLLWPYRSALANVFEAICSISVVYNSSFMASFAFLHDAGAESGSVGNLSAVITWSPVALGVAALTYLSAVGLQIKFRVGMGPRLQKRRDAAMEQNVATLRGAFSRMANLNPAETQLLLQQVNDYDLWCLHMACTLLQVELEQGTLKKTLTPQLSTKSMIEISRLAEDRAQLDREKMAYRAFNV